MAREVPGVLSVSRGFVHNAAMTSIRLSYQAFPVITQQFYQQQLSFSAVVRCNSCILPCNSDGIWKKI